MATFKTLDIALQELVIQHGREAVLLAVTTLTAAHCNHCGYDWNPRKAGTPAMCPRCKSVRWNK